MNLVQLAKARWHAAEGMPLASLPGFLESRFTRLVAHAADDCLGQVYGQVPMDPVRGRRTAIVLVSTWGDLDTDAAIAIAVDQGRRVSPMLFFQSVPNAVAGRVAATWGLTGPVMCVGRVGDGATDALDLVELLLADGDADEALLVQVEQACRDGESDHVLALLIGPQTRLPNHLETKVNND
jgi:3-oxoacyl-(acyl-carrier-protein) synthase